MPISQIKLRPLCPSVKFIQSIQSLRRTEDFSVTHQILVSRHREWYLSERQVIASVTHAVLKRYGAQIELFYLPYF
jgi:hypothetical protein